MGRDCRLTSLLYRGLNFNAGKSKVMVLNREKGLECEVHVDMIHSEDVSELKYFGMCFG